MECIRIKNLDRYKGEKVEINGIIEKIEDHGGILFLEVSDLSFLARAVIIPDEEKAVAIAKNLKNGYLVRITGIVKESPQGSNALLCEIEVETLAIISARTRVENMIKIAKENNADCMP